MELSEIEAFVTIQRTGGFTRAAELLHLSQPAVSRRIELLERELGVALFERLSNGIRLTEAGQAFLPYAQQVLTAIVDGKAAIHALEEEEQGTIELALVGTLASTQLTTHLQAFREAYPRVHLRLRTARSDEVSTLVQQGDAHLGLRYFADPHPDIHFIETPIILIVVIISLGWGTVPGILATMVWTLMLAFVLQYSHATPMLTSNTFALTQSENIFGLGLFAIRRLPLAVTSPAWRPDAAARRIWQPAHRRKHRATSDT
nr:LysR family transcriptional regulator [Ktedonobacter racemifer]